MEAVERFPGGSSLSALDWESVAAGGVWLFTMEELEAQGTKPETLRVYAHKVATDLGIKFRTKLTDKGLYIERR